MAPPCLLTPQALRCTSYSTACSCELACTNACSTVHCWLCNFHPVTNELGFASDPSTVAPSNAIVTVSGLTWSRETCCCPSSFDLHLTCFLLGLVLCLSCIAGLSLPACRFPLNTGPVVSAHLTASELSGCRSDAEQDQCCLSRLISIAVCSG